MDEEKKLTVRLPPEMARQIEALAEKGYRSLHGQILYLINRGLEAEREAERRRAAQGGAGWREVCVRLPRR